MAFDQTTRNRLQRFVTDARTLLANEFTRQLQATYGMNPKTGEVAAISSLSGLTPSQQETAQLLRDTLDHYLASAEKGKDKARKTAALERIVREQAFTVLNRLAALRMSEARGFLIESLAKGYQSKGFQLFHNLAGISLGETGDAYRHYLYGLFDEFSLDLSVLFDRFSAQGRLFPGTSELLNLLALINDESIAPLWAEDETIGWIYQYFNSIEERKKMREESQAPRNSRELAVRNQFFTPRYVVEFLTDNTLGRIWYEMTQGNTELKTCCKYLVRRPNEFFLAPAESAPEQEENLDLSQEELLQQTVYIEYRPLKDPRDIRMLDPACGSMHFGLYAFDLFEAIYNEAWDIEVSQGAEIFIREQGKMPLTQEYSDKAEFIIDVPRLIIENNIHGVDIDPRATQIAGLSLWLRAHNSWQQAGIKPQNRPKIQRSNIVCAEPMPGEKALLEEFTATLKPTVLGQLVEIIFEKMELAGEAGTLLKIEQEIQDAIIEAKQVWQQQNQALSQFPDLAKVARQRGEIAFDVGDIDDEEFWEQAEQKILDALAEYAQSATTGEGGQKRLFSEDAVKGFAFIELCRKRFDAVLMNPPFGEPTDKTLYWMSNAYSNAVRNVYIAFIERGRLLLTNNGYVGAITDSTFIHQSRYEKFRSSIVNDKDFSLTHLVANGWGVLDAYVETACSIIGRPYSNDIFMVDLRNSNQKEIELSARILQLSDNFENLLLEIFLPKSAFQKLPKNTLTFWLPERILRLFAEQPRLDFEQVDPRCGMSSSDNTRFYKLWWEVDAKELGRDKQWSFLSNGGTPAPFLRPQTYVVNYKNSGQETKIRVADLYGSASRTIINEGYYRRPGFTYGKRTESLTVQILPENHIFSNEGQSVFPKCEDSQVNILAYLNTSLVAYILNSIAGQHKEAGYVGAIPCPPKFFLENEEVKKRTVRAIEILHECYKSVPEYQYFCSPYLSDSIFQGIGQIVKKLSDLSNEFAYILNANDVELNKLVGCADGIFSEFTNRNWNLINIVYQCDVDDVDEVVASDIFSYLIGSIFGRWDVSKRSLEQPIKTLDFYFQKIPLLPYAVKDNLLSHNKCIYESIINESCEISDHIVQLSANLFTNSEYFLSELLLALKKDDIRKMFQGKCSFFDYHLSRYSKSRRQAPIYWPLQTISGSYTLWLYYHGLNKQILFTCVNDFVAPKLQSIREDLITLKNKPSRSDVEEKEFGRLTDLKLELEDFHDELLRIAKFWKPNLNDGVQITAAPLWRLFQHKPWQKKLKETWEQLEGGEYDWAHLAYSVWPERVLRKCHQDRSLAIAHEVEDELWHEVEVIKPRKKLPVWEWQPKPLSEVELNAFIQTKIQAQGTAA